MESGSFLELCDDSETQKEGLSLEQIAKEDNLMIETHGDKGGRNNGGCVDVIHLLRSLQDTAENPCQNTQSPRRSSLPTDSKMHLPDQKTNQQQLRRRKSTPNAFAPLCVLPNSELRYLHGCASHDALPHLYDVSHRRRASCPSPSTLTAKVSDKKIPSRKRRQSYPITKPSFKEDCFNLHRCNGHIETSCDPHTCKGTNGITSEASTSEPLSCAEQTVNTEPRLLASEPHVILTAQSLEAADAAEELAAEPLSSFPSCTDGQNSIARSVELLEKWSASVLENSNLKIVAALRRNNSISSNPSLHSIAEE
eukprot:gene9984-11006_t